MLIPKKWEYPMLLEGNSHKIQWNHQMAYFSLAIFYGPRLSRGFAQGAGALLGASGEEHATDSAETMASSVVSWESCVCSLEFG